MPVELSTKTLKAAAAFFGIKSAVDANGTQQWSIEVDTRHTHDLSSTRTATFDDSAKQWMISKQTSLTDRERKRSFSKRELTESLDHGFPPAGLQYITLTDSPPAIEHGRNMKSVRWSQNPLGEPHLWDPSLQVYSRLIVSMDHPAVIYWAGDRVAFYNESFRPLLSGRHDKFLGATSRSTPLASEFHDVFTQLETYGKGMTLPRLNVFAPHGQHLKETWWVGHFSPILNDEGCAQGFLGEYADKTKEVLLDRRISLINEIGHPSVKALKTPIWGHIQSVFIRSPEDVAMAIFYSAETTQDQHHILQLQSTIGVPDNHQAAPSALNLSSDTHGWARAMRVSLAAAESWTNLTSIDPFPHEVLEGIDWQGYGEKSRTVVIIPIVVLDGLLKGFVILGLNPRAEFDSAHSQFVSDLRRELVATFTSEFSRRAADEREAQFSLQLAESERRVRSMAELAPVGMYELSAQGPLKWANEHFFEILGCTRPKDLSEFSWQDWLLAEDIMVAMNGLMKGIMERTDVSGALRLNRKWKPPRPPTDVDEFEEEEHAWMLYQAYPHVEDGNVVSLMGCLTDISQFKWAESVQARSAEAARLAKQRQEDFIDITSHEMRNPLSAIQQCADSIAASWTEHLESGGGSEDLIQRVKSNVDAAQSILLCAMHQRRIIDDVLTLSKIESAMLSVVPVGFEPKSIIDDALQMFIAEFTSSDIEVKTSYTAGTLRNGELVMCDPARLMQVLINLLTNAIKFTRPRAQRLIQISCGCTSSPPPAAQFGDKFAWSSSGKARPDLTSLPEYGQGDILYVYFSVIDTGQGLPSKHAVRIFDKFVQASRRTHIKYGGSGLGLFISRELTEVQGGQIGVESDEGIGSNFTFYVRVRRSTEQSLRSPKRVLDVEAMSQKLSHKDRPPAQPATLTSPTRSAYPTQAKPTRRYTILMVEDNLLNQKVLAKHMRKVGCEIHLANHGGEAIDFVLRASGLQPEYDKGSSASASTRANSPNPPLNNLPPSTPTLEDASSIVITDPHSYPTIDCILMDWEMPVCDGLTATRRIRNLESHNPPLLRQRRHLIIGVTANARREQIAVAMEAGMDAVVVKPFSVKELMSKIDELITGTARR